MASPLPESIRRNSASASELVLSEQDAIEALNFLDASGFSVLGWEGWLRSPTGQLGHSGLHQGTADLTSLSRQEAYDLCRRTIKTSAAEHRLRQERPNHEFLF